jgi:hypothetical protein
VIEGRRAAPKTATVLQERPHVSSGRPSDHPVVVEGRHDQVHPHAQGRQLKGGQDLLIRQEIRRRDPDREFREIDGGQEHENELVHLLVRRTS